MEGQNKNDNISSKLTIPTILEAANFLKNPQNKDKLFHGLTYEEISFLIRNFVMEIGVDTEEIEDVDLFEFLSTQLDDPVNIESKIPVNLRDLVEAFENSQADLLKAAIEYEKNRKQRQKSYQRLKEETKKRLIEQLVDPSKEEDVIQAFLEKIEINEDIRRVKEGIADSSVSETDREILRKELINGFKSQLVSAAEKTAKELNLTEEEKAKLKTIEIPLEGIYELCEKQGSLTENEKAKAIFKKAFDPVLPKNNVEKLIDYYTPVLISNFPEIDTSNLGSLTPEEQTASLEKIREAIRERAIFSLSLCYENLIKDGINLTSEQTTELIERFLPQSIEDLNNNFELFLKIPQIEKPAIFEEPSFFSPLIKREVNLRENPLLFTLPENRIEGDFLKIEDSDGKTFIQAFKEVYKRDGVSQKGVNPIKEKLGSLQGTILACLGQEPEDIENTIERLIAEGKNENSQEIRDLKQARENLLRFLTKKPDFPIESLKRERQKNLQRGVLPARLFFAASQPRIEDEERKTRQGFFGRIINSFKSIFGKKYIFIGKSEVLAINKLDLFLRRASQKILQRFYQSTIGKGVKKFLQGAAQKSLQVAWTTIKTGAQQVIKKAATTIAKKIAGKIALKLGSQVILQLIGSAVPVIGNIVMFLFGDQVLKLAKNIIFASFINSKKAFKKVYNTIASGFGVFTSVFNSFGQSSSDLDPKILTFVLPLVFILLPFLTWLSLLNKINSFINKVDTAVSTVFKKSEEFFDVVKTVDRNEIENNEINRDFKYRITILNKKYTLNGVKFKDDLYRKAQGGIRIDDLREEELEKGFPPKDFRVPKIEPGETYSFEYTVTIPSEIINSQVINEVTVEANVGGPVNKIRRGSAIIYIGDSLNPNAQCDNPRHLGEETVCAISLTPPCSYKIIDKNSRLQIGKCLDNIKMGNIDILKSILQNYKCDKESCFLQCVQFVIAIQNALGQPLESKGSASLYASEKTPKYRKLNPNEVPVSGDLVVWSNKFGGHIAIYLGTLGETKLIVAEANGENGKILAGERPNLSHGTKPVAYLRYCGDNCPED